MRIAVAATLLLAAARPTLAAPESDAQRLHRKGVRCMDELERPDCAIENLEALLGEHEAERELVTDALVRLLSLYERKDDTDAIQRTLRRFWDVGMRRRSLGHVPYSTRFLPDHLDVFVALDVREIRDATVWTGLDFDALTFLFTCDEAERQDVLVRHRWKRAALRAQAEGRETAAVYDEDRTRAEAERQKREQGRPPSASRPTVDPLFLVAACPIAQALDHTDLRQWTRMAGALDHRDFAQSIGVAEIPELDQRLAEAVAAGRLVARGGHFLLPDFDYAGGEFVLVTLDRNELMVVPTALLEPVLTARKADRTHLHRDVERMILEVPRDSGAFVVLTSAAIDEIAMSGMRPSTRTMLQALLPRPKGLQVAAVFHSAIGVFTRMPTDTPLRGSMLVRLARAFIDARNEGDAEPWLRHLDITETKDRRALLMAYLLSRSQLRQILWE